MADVVEKVEIERCKPEFKRIYVNPDFCKIGDNFIFKKVKYNEKWKTRIQSLLQGVYSIPEYYEYFLRQGSRKKSFVVGIHRDEKEKDFVFFSDSYDAHYKIVTDPNSPNFGLENLRVEKREKIGTQPHLTRDIRIKGNGQVVYIYSEQSSSEGLKRNNRLNESVEIVSADEEQAYDIYRRIYGKKNDGKKMYEGILEEYKKGCYICQKAKDGDGNQSIVYEHYPENGKPAARIKISNIGGTINFVFDPNRNEYKVHRGILSRSSAVKWVEENGCPELKETLLRMFEGRSLAMPQEIKNIFNKLDQYIPPVEDQIR